MNASFNLKPGQINGETGIWEMVIGLEIHAQISSNVVVSSAVNILEIWDKVLYETAINDAKTDFGDLAEEVMGSNNNDDVS